MWRVEKADRAALLPKDSRRSAFAGVAHTHAGALQRLRALAWEDVQGS
jgi:hypothetical protein